MVLSGMSSQLDSGGDFLSFCILKINFHFSHHFVIPNDSGVRATRIRLKDDGEVSFAWMTGTRAQCSILFVSLLSSCLTLVSCLSLSQLYVVPNAKLLGSKIKTHSGMEKRCFEMKCCAFLLTIRTIQFLLGE